LVAAQVLELMLKRGYKAQTFHFNMLLKALIRTKESANILKAENIGWHMIEAARRLPQRRDPPQDTTAHSHYGSTDIVQRAPPANVTTFALIMQHHANSLQWDHVDYLSRQLKETVTEPNATIMNVLMDNKCRQGAYSEAWMIYKNLTEPQEGSTGVFPNGASIRCLWKTLRLALGDHTNPDKSGLPTPRELLAETINWWTVIRSRYDITHHALLQLHQRPGWLPDRSARPSPSLQHLSHRRRTANSAKTDSLGRHDTRD
jgi:hypothetical protein